MVVVVAMVWMVIIIIIIINGAAANDDVLDDDKDDAFEDDDDYHDGNDNVCGASMTRVVTMTNKKKSMGKRLGRRGSFNESLITSRLWQISRGC